MLVHRKQDQSSQYQRRLGLRWVLIIALGCLVFALTMHEGIGVAVSATVATVALLHTLLE